MAYSEDERKEIIIGICNNVIENKISFNQAIDESEITLTSFYSWIVDDANLQKLYNYARQIRSDILFEEIIEIADNQEEGEEVSNEFDANGVTVKTVIKKGDMFKQRQLKIDARKWVVAKMQPKKYGDKLDVTTDGEKIQSTPTIVFKDSFNE